MLRIRFALYSLSFFILFSCKPDVGGLTKRLFKKHEGKPGFFIFDVPPYLINTLISNTEQEKPLKAALEKFERINILMFKTYNEKIERKDKYFQEFNDYYSEHGFDNLALMQKYKEKAMVKFHPDIDEKQELIILFSDANSLIVLSLKGTFDYSMLSTLLKFKNIETLKAIKD